MYISERYLLGRLGGAAGVFTGVAGARARAARGTGTGSRGTREGTRHTGRTAGPHCCLGEWGWAVSPARPAGARWPVVVAVV